MTARNTNPAGNPRFSIGKPTIARRAGAGPPMPDVARKQDPRHTKKDFLRDLDKDTQRRDDRP
jgi:hypothetical protein